MEINLHRGKQDVGLIAAAVACAQGVSHGTTQLGRRATLTLTHRDGAYDQVRAEGRVRVFLPLAVMADQLAGYIVVEGRLQRFEGDRRHDAGIRMTSGVPPRGGLGARFSRMSAP